MDELKSYLVGLVLGLSCGALMGVNIYKIWNSNRLIPSTNQVQQGYAIPNKLEVKLRDLDHNGKNEVLMKYDENLYLLTLDEQGIPQVQAYEVKPAEVVPKE